MPHFHDSDGCYFCKNEKGVEDGATRILMIAIAVLAVFGAGLLAVLLFGGGN